MPSELCPRAIGLGDIFYDLVSGEFFGTGEEFRFILRDLTLGKRYKGETKVL